MARNDKLMNVRIPTKLHEDYKQFCEDASYTLSKRIRKLMENDLKKWNEFKKERGIT